MIIKYYLNKIDQICKNYYYYSCLKLYKLKKIRNKLKQIKDINNVIYILKELNANNINNSDNILNTIYACYLLEPPNDNELQKLSELQQLYNNKLNIEEYSIMTLWCCTIHYIDNLPKIKKQKTWP